MYKRSLNFVQGFAGNCIISEHELSCKVWLKTSGIIIMKNKHLTEERRIKIFLLQKVACLRQTLAKYRFQNP